MGVELHNGDCLSFVGGMDAESVHAVVTDPPYHLQSIVKRFAKSGRTESTRSKSGPHQRVAAGFMGEQWDGGNISFQPETWAAFARVMKPGGHLAAFGGTRTFHRLAVAIEDAGLEIRDTLMWVYGSGFPKSHNQKGEWGGWGTGLKPAWEPIILARKPIEGTVAQNLAKHRTGAVNIDACRIPSVGGRAREGEASQDRRYAVSGATNFAVKPGPRGGSPYGRWPANLIHDGSDEVMVVFPNAPGQQGALSGNEPSSTFAREPCGDGGSAARFFYCAKASRSDREDGCVGLPRAFGKIANHHPTVKPTALMRWACRLVAPPGGIILDPFMGSGSTGRGAVTEGFDFIGIEREAKYFEIAKRRIAAVAPASEWAS